MPPAGHDVGVAVDDLDALHGHAGPVGDEHRPGRVVALAVGRRAGADAGAAVGPQLDRAVLAAAGAGGDLDVDRQADAELARGRRPPAGAACSARSSS